MNVLFALMLALVTPETSSHFERFADPQSGVVSYLMRDGTFESNQQSLYFTQRSMTDDGRFLVLTTAPYEFAPEYLKKGAKVPRRLAAVDFADDSTFVFGPEGKYSIPYVDVVHDAVYTVDFDLGKLMKYDLRDKGRPVAEYGLPKEVSDLGRVKWWYTHLTLSADRAKAFFDAGLATGKPGPERCVEGVLDLATGTWTKWGEAPFVCDHGQISQVDDNLALCAMENVVTAYKKDGSYPRMWLLRPGERCNIPSKTILHATHEIWDDDGTGFYWCSRTSDRGQYGVFRYDLKTGEETCLSPMMSMHAMTSADRRYVVYDWPLPPLGRGSAWRVGFYDRETGANVYVFTFRPAISDFAKDEKSVLHPDPHPQFVMGGRYVVSTANLPGRHMTLAVTPVEPLKAATSAPCGKVERTATGVRLVKGGETVWNFEIDTDDGKPYMHPLRTPSGLTLTDVRPSDHPWHKGLWFSWKFLNGANCWETPDKCGPGGAGRCVLKSKEISVAGLDARVTLSLVHGDGEGKALEERRTVDFLPPDEVGGYALLSEHEFTALRDVTLDRTPPYAKPNGAMAGGYAGLTLRLTADAAARFATRKDGKDIVEFVCPERGESVLFHAYEEPKTAKFYAWPDRRMLNLSPVWNGPFALKAGEKLRLRYVVQVKADKKPDAQAKSR